MVQRCNFVIYDLVDLNNPYCLTGQTRVVRRGVDGVEIRHGV